MGRPKGSKNQSSKENSNPNIPEPPRTTLSAKAQPKKNAKSTKTSPPPDAEKQTRQRAIFSEDDDLVMIHTLLEQKDEGMASVNGGWKKLAINAVVRALEGSELISGGSPKTFRSVQDHYTKLKNDYRILKELASISGWGWDSENHRVQASEEQWETYLLAHPKMVKYKNMTFSIYEDLDQLLDGALATGNAAFCAGGPDSEEDSDDDMVGNGTDHDPDSESDNGEVIFGASKVAIDASTPLKRKSSARESVGGSSAKRVRRDRSNGRLTTAAAISQMSSAVGQMAAAFSVGDSNPVVTPTSAGPESMLVRAVKLIEKEDFLTTVVKAHLMQVTSSPYWLLTVVPNSPSSFVSTICALS
ncbi:hypothetical protein F5050DRAFT_1710898 [Lentinula boryana]|uniref:Myb/SANT-like domain-containing protein n=1 Tax=Lentinula boryana TaxID=40481 RepID=A0ABQ8QHB9_9AGAR|nr:hypothetical protein F5050DRAFT_1710898 [Lentinula boryana]